MPSGPASYAHQKACIRSIGQYGVDMIWGGYLYDRLDGYIGVATAMGLPELARLLVDLERRTGLEFDARSFESRLRIQKTAYFLKALGHPAVHSYGFGDYFYGPYSPTLARDYYALRKQGLLEGARRVSRPPPSGRAFYVISKAIEQGNEFLEAAATLHSLIHHNRGLSRGSAEVLLKIVKPRAATHFSGAWEFLGRSDLLPPG
jgi:uncharacterized protein YwgA